MRGFPVLGLLSAFLLGAAIAVAIHPKPLVRDFLTYLNGGSAMDRCRSAGACNAVQRAPEPRRLKAPEDLDRA